MSNFPSVHLNHFYIVTDPATYRDILQCPFMRSQFAATELRTTTRQDMAYTGLYFYGVNTYFEFFDASNSLAAKQFTGDGLAFGVDRRGELKTVEEKLAAQFAFEKELITRQYNDAQIPWFHSVKLKGFPAAPAITVWLMEYQPRFLKEWNPQPQNQNQGVSREKILQRYVSVLKDVPARPIFQDIAALTLAAKEPAREALTRLAVALGCKELPGDGATELVCADFKLRIVPPAGAKQGIQAFTMRLSANPGGPTGFCFGKNSRLKFHDNNLATWSFDN